MAAFAGCTDARNSRAGKILSVILAGTLSFSFLNVANAGYAFADEGEDTGGQTTEVNPPEGSENAETEDPTTPPTLNALHQDFVNFYQFYAEVNGQTYLMEAATQTLTDGEDIVMPKAPVFGGMQCTGWELDESLNGYVVEVAENTYKAKVTEEANSAVVTFVAKYERINALTFVDDTNVVIATKLPTDKALTEADLTAVNDAYEPKAGFVFKGWTPDPVLRPLVNWEAFSVEDSYTLYPVVDPGTWVMFDTEADGSFVPSTLLGTNREVRIPTTVPTRPNYTFAYWEDSLGHHVKDGDLLDGGAAETLHAVWTPGETTEPDPSGTPDPDESGTTDPSGSETSDPTDPAGSDPADPAGSDPTDPTDPETPSAENGQLSLATLASEVASAMNDADDSTTSLVKTVDENMLNEDGTIDWERLNSQNDVADLILSNPNGFLGWYYKDGTDYLPFYRQDVITAPFELTARFRPEPVVITYYEDGGIEHTDGRMYSPNADALVVGPTTEVLASNMRFDHWTIGNTETEVRANDVVPVSTLQAGLHAACTEDFTPRVHTITFDANYNVQGVDAPEATQMSFTHNDQVTIPNYVQGIPTGLTLTGWKTTDSEGKDVILGLGELWRVKDNTTLYAQYERDETAIHLKDYVKDPLTNIATITERYTGGTFTVELIDTKLLPGEQFVWRNLDAGENDWQYSAKTFGPEVGDDEVVELAILDDHNNPVWRRVVTLHIDPAVLTVSPCDVTVAYGQALPQPTVSTATVVVKGWKGDDAELVNNLLEVYNFSAQYQLGDNDPANLPVGVYPIKLTKQDNPEAQLAEGMKNYTLESADGTLTVEAAGTSLISSFYAPGFPGGNRTYDGNAALVEAQAADEGDTVYYRVNEGEWTTEVPRLVNAGEYTIDARAENPNKASSEASRAIYRVLPKPVTITVDGATKYVYTDDPEFTGTVTGLVGTDTLNVEYYRANTSTATGSYRVYARYTENPNYTVTVTPGVLIIRPLPTQIVPPVQDPINPAPTQPTNPSTPVQQVQPTRPGLPIDPSVQLPSQSTQQQPTQQQPAQQQPTPTPSGDQGGNAGDAYQAAPTQDNGASNVQYVYVPVPGETTTTTTISPDAPAGATETGATTTTPEATDGADAMVIDDAETPMASAGAPVYSPSTTIDTGMDTPVAIDDDGNPLATPDQPMTWIYWAVLLIVLVGAGFGFLMVRRRMARLEEAALVQSQVASTANGQYAPIPEYRVR